MKCVVTGCAGFIGSHLAEALLRRGDSVVGVDCFTPYYDRSIKERNLEGLKALPGFRFESADVAEGLVPDLLEGVDAVFHLAAQAGVRASWGEQFSEYVHHNIQATQRLLETCRGKRIGKIVYASSSSVYGEPGVYPLSEELSCQPVSPYGITKLTAEHLCMLYHRSYGMPCVALRYFTVYGPRQRPDMAFHKLLRARLKGEAAALYGDGKQTRDFTFIRDAVEATMAATESPDGEVINVGGGSRVSMLDVLKIIEETTGGPVRVDRAEPQRGDMRHTWADLSKASRLLKYEPKVALREGLALQWEWMKSMG